MRPNILRKQIGELLSKLDQAELSGDAGTAQETYEELFTLCRQNSLDLDALLQQPRTHPEPRGIRGTLKALWPTS